MREKDIDSLNRENIKWICCPSEKEKKASDSFEVVLATEAPTNFQIVNLINELRNELKNDLF